MSRSDGDLERFSEDCVCEELAKLKVDKLMGPDGIHPRILKELGDILTGPLTELFNASSELGVVPKDWREANVGPLHKSGSKDVVENYRPVSLTSVDSCSESVLRCFLEELKVVVHECGDLQKEATKTHVKFLKVNAGLEDLPYNNVSKECKQCEQYQEKDFQTFMKDFKELVTKFNSEKRRFTSKPLGRTARAAFHTESSKPAVPDTEKTASENKELSTSN